MITNFEKWKLSLQPEDLIFDENVVFDCDNQDCPAAEYCFGLGDDMETCGKTFRDWSEATSNEI